MHRSPKENPNQPNRIGRWNDNLTKIQKQPRVLGNALNGRDWKGNSFVNESDENYRCQQQRKSWSENRVHVIDRRESNPKESTDQSDIFPDENRYVV